MDEPKSIESRVMVGNVWFFARGLTGHVFNKRMRRVGSFVITWVALNVVAWNIVDRIDQRSLEDKFRLRAGILREFQSRELSFVDDNQKSVTLRYRVFKPQGSFSAKTLPVLLFLHGSGERGWDNASQLKYLPTLLTEPSYQRTYPCTIIVPQCPPNINWDRFRSLCLNKSNESSPASRNDILLRMVDDVLGERQK